MCTKTFISREARDLNYGLSLIYICYVCEQLRLWPVCADSTDPLLLNYETHVLAQCLFFFSTKQFSIFYTINIILIDLLHDE